MSSDAASLFAFLLFVLLFVLERFFPLRQGKRSLVLRVLVNLAMSALMFLTAIGLVRPAAEWALRWSTERPFGLVHLVALPPALEVLISFLLMDLTFYYWHLANHQVPFLWRFHNVHHTDPDLDVSTAFRFHFGEIVLSSFFTLIQVVVIGPSVLGFAVYQLAFQAEVLFHHSNVRLPIEVERWLNRLLVTPRMHGIHHSEVERENKSNFGTVLSWWDRIHRTLGVNIPQDEVVVGIPAYTLPGDNRFWNALLIPFQKQRNYWRRPDGTIPERRATADQDPSRLSD